MVVKLAKSHVMDIFSPRRYCSITSDVFTSIKRTEDSLLRLKRTRKQGGASGAGSADSSTTMSDDDKIRLQFAIDVEEFGQVVRVSFYYV